MAGIKIDPDKLKPADRAAFEQVARAEIARLEAEQDEAAERMAGWAEQDASDKLIRENRAKRTEASRSARLASAETAGAMSGVEKHLTRLADPNLTGQERAAEQSLALAAYRSATEWRAMAANLRTRAEIISEPDVYSRTSPHSWFADVGLMALQTAGGDARSAAVERLTRYGKQLAAESRSQDARGAYVRQALRNVTRRHEDRREDSAKQYRAMTSGSTSGGPFVAPYFVTEDYSTFRAQTPSFLEQAITMRPLPAYGLTVQVPAFTGPAGVAVQSSENTAPSETDPSGTYRTAPVSTFDGSITGSLQLVDRGGPIAVDSVIYSQIREQYDAALDVAVITAALSGATAFTRATYSHAGLFADIGKMSASLESTSGTALPPSALVMTPTMGEWLLSQVGSDNRPIFLPAPGAGGRSDGFLGYSPSGVPLYADGNIPASGSNAQLLVTNKAAVFLYAGEPICQTLMETANASTLSVVFRCYGYAAPMVRYPAGTAVTSGAAYPTAVTWA